MGRITYPTAAECRKATSVCRRLSKRYAENWRVRVIDRQGGLSVNVVMQKNHALHAKVATVDWFGFDRTVAETTADIVAEVDAILAKIAERPLFTIVASTPRISVDHATAEAKRFADRMQGDWVLRWDLDDEGLPVNFSIAGGAAGTIDLDVHTPQALVDALDGYE